LTVPPNFEATGSQPITLVSISNNAI
jgi:hypothetical protein